MHEDFEYVKSLEKEIDELESEKADFSNIYDLLLEECVSKDVLCSYLHSLSELNAHTELQCMYLHKVKECECLAQKLSKQTESVNNEVHNKLLKKVLLNLGKPLISLELSLQHCKEQMKNNPACKENASNVFRKEREQYHEIQDLKAQMQDKNMFDKPHSVVRQPNAQRIPKPSVLGKPTPFSNSPEMRSFQTNQSVNKTNASDGLFKPVTQQNLPQNRTIEISGTGAFWKWISLAPISCYGDLIQGNVTIKRVYYVEGLNHNLFSVGQFCDADLEVAFRKSTCFVRDLEGKRFTNVLKEASPTQECVYGYRGSFLKDKRRQISQLCPVLPQGQNVVPSAEDDRIRHNKGCEFSSVLYWRYYNPTRSHDFRWTRDHPLEQVRVNPTMPVQTRRRLCPQSLKCVVFALFTTKQSGELVDKPFGKMVIMLKWLWKNKKDEDQTVNSPTKARRVAKGYAQEGVLILKESFAPVARLEQEVCVAQPEGSLIQFIRKCLPSEESFVWINRQLLEPGTRKLSILQMSKGFTKDVVWSGEPFDQSDYHSKIGSLMFLTSSRPGTIVQAVTINIGTWYQGLLDFDEQHFQTVLMRGCLDTRKGLLGITVLGVKLVSWISKKRIIAPCNVFSRGRVRGVICKLCSSNVDEDSLQDYGFNYNKIPLYCDSQSAIAISCNLVHLLDQEKGYVVSVRLPLPLDVKSLT
ncbi:retrovirus-related pol polyprotein from transposon TNT 1-94 [Tanacetum coccineum]